MVNQPGDLQMSFDPKTIEHLGVKMYSQLPNAIAELIANTYDACAEHVKISLTDKPEKSIVVEDDGTGMTFDEINSKFLRIGRNRRETEDAESTCNRIPTGKKGLGKLAFFGIGTQIEVESRRDGEAVTFIMDWNELLGTPDGENYRPHFEKSKCSPKEHGTKITLLELKRKSNFKIDELTNSLAKLFNFQDETFEVEIVLNNKHSRKIDPKTKYEDLVAQFSWEFPDFSEKVSSDYKHRSDIKGKIITTEKPSKEGLRGVTLFANGRMVNAREFFGQSESSHFYSYTTGWLDVDFVDNWEEDVISTNRQSLDREHPEIQELRSHLKLTLAEIERDWREKRKVEKIKNLDDDIDLNLEEWTEALPDEIETDVTGIVARVIDDAELSHTQTNQVIERLHRLVPEYPYYHWRHLHPIVKDASKTEYKDKDYYRAFIEAVKRYISSTQEKSNSAIASPRGMMGAVFGESGILSVTKPYNKPGGAKFLADTLVDIEEGQKHYSMGVCAGARNPISHEEIANLRDSGLFVEKDCLDALSLLSHLFRRLDDV